MLAPGSRLMPRIVLTLLLLAAALPGETQDLDTFQESVLQAYLAYYGRPPDAGGLDYWASQLAMSDGSLNAIIDAFGDSEEFIDRYGGLSSAALINNLYQQLFGRDAESGGLDYWVEELDSGRRSLQSIALDVLYGAANSDAMVIDNRLEVGRAFIAAMDNEETIAAYSGNTVANGAAELLRGVTSEYPTVTAAIDQFEGRFLEYVSELVTSMQLSGDQFRDCAGCPLMAIIPAGTFTMGSNAGDASEQPAHQVTVGAFAIGVFEITGAEWRSCYDDANSCFARGTGTGSFPVSRVSWNNVKQYLSWLSERAGATYRLPSEAEWEYAARAGTSSKYWWGNDIGTNRANCNEQCGDAFSRTGPVGSYEASPFGLFDVHGNLYEWTQDCLNDSYAGAPTDGSASVDGDCSFRRLKGGSWADAPEKLRSAFRGYGDEGGQFTDSGFRVLREL